MAFAFDASASDARRSPLAPFRQIGTAATASAISVSPLDRFHLHALVLAGFRILKVRIDAGLIRIERVLVLSARIELRRIGLCRAAAARKRKRAKRDDYPLHWPRSISETGSGSAE